jgi:sugar lactone lactonase YvrE
VTGVLVSQPEPEEVGVAENDIDGELKPIGTGTAILGECPTWWPKTGELRWVDIRAREVRSLSLARRQLRKWPVPGLVAGISVTDQGRMLVALETELCLLDEETASIEPLAKVADTRPGMRFNEVRCDARGRIWLGWMNDATRGPEGCLFRVDGSAFTPVIGNVAVPNSLAWSPDYSLMYFADGREPVIWCFDFDLETGAIANRRVFATLPEGRGIPDGAAVDADGFLWSANYGGWAVTRYTPAGSVDRVIDLPVSQPTSCGFGGDDLGVLFVTSASQRLSADQLSEQPLAGELFAMRVPVTGLPLPTAAERPLAESSPTPSEGS